MRLVPWALTRREMGGVTDALALHISLPHAGAQAVDRVLAKGTLSGGDKKAVYELKEACHLKLACCDGALNV